MKKLLSLLSICSFVLITTAQIPINGLIAWYPFSGNAHDSSGNGNNGTVLGASLTHTSFLNIDYTIALGTTFSLQDILLLLQKFHPLN